MADTLLGALHVTFLPQLSFPYSSIAANIGRAAAAIVLCFTYPIECFVARAAVDAVLFPRASPSTLRHCLITLAIVLSTSAVGFATDKLSVVFELSGGFSAVMLAYLLPALLSLRLGHGACMRS